MTQGFYAGLSGIQTHQYAIDVVSDNLANVNTVGFRGANTEFASLLSTKIVSAGARTPTSNDMEIGVRLQATTMNTTGGTLINTDRFNDLAIGGNGWFGVSSGTNNYFTRAGNFVFDEYQKTPGVGNSSVARFTTGDGMYVMGTMLENFAYDATNDYEKSLSVNPTATNRIGAFVIGPAANDVPLAGIGKQGPLELPTRLAYPVEPSTISKFSGNLGFTAGSSTGLTEDTRTMSSDVISGNNERNRLKLVFTQSTVQPATGVAWDIAATVTTADGEITYDTQAGQATFGASGRLLSSTLPTMDNDGSPAVVDLSSYLGGIISTAGVPVSASSQSDGTMGGTLTKYGINNEGLIIADFSNGRQSAIGRVAVYHFQNEQGLERNGGALYRQSSNSGNPTFWTDKNGNAIAGAKITSGQLENSNARLDVGLTDLIILQRAYQANAKTLTTFDEMIQKALQMRR